MNITIINHSGYGHTKIVAEHVQKGPLMEVKSARLHSTIEAQDNFELLHQSDASVFGCPTYMGTISAESKNLWKQPVNFGTHNRGGTNSQRVSPTLQLSMAIN
jgi:NAD(P)H dehydrogenase (quinone)